jgi:hypothetical protein
MAENAAKANQYQYSANASLVLQADRKHLPRRDQEPTGEPETLHGRIDPREFGSRAVREAPKDKEQKKKKAEKAEEIEERKRRKKEQRYVCIPGMVSFLCFVFTNPVYLSAIVPLQRSQPRLWLFFGFGGYR